MKRTFNFVLLHRKRFRVEKWNTFRETINILPHLHYILIFREKQAALDRAAELAHRMRVRLESEEPIEVENFDIFIRSSSKYELKFIFFAAKLN